MGLKAKDVQARLAEIREENKDEKMLDIWDEKLSEYAINIYKYRNR